MENPVRFRASIEPLDLDLTLGCGQTFRWWRLQDGSWKGILGRDVVRLVPEAGGLSAETHPGNRGAMGRVVEYLRATDDLGSVHQRLSEDPVIARGLERVEGLRLVKMPPWECMLSYVLATNANIKRIRGMIDALATRFGDPVAEGLSAIPEVERLGRASVAELTECGLGYRAEYVHRLCQAVDERDISRMERLPYEDLRLRLKGLPGIGDKVADCVSLFGFGHLESFPIDVWMERSLERLYGVKGSYAKLRAFASERFGLYAGYAQEYLYFNEWALASKGRCVFSSRNWRQGGVQQQERDALG